MSIYINPKAQPRSAKGERFAATAASVYFGDGRRYLIDDEWQPGPPPDIPDATRVAFDGLDAFVRAKDAFYAWQTIEARRGEKTVLPDKAFSRLATARETQTPLTLFVPWGIKPNWRDEMADRPRPELEALERIAEFQRALAENRIPTRVLIMPADIYATEVNNFDPAVAQSYMDWLQRQTNEYGFELKPWSAIRAENQTRYAELREQYGLETLESDRAMRVRLAGAYKTAAKRSGYDTPDQRRQAGYSYIRERLCEAAIIDEVYEPIKVSCVEPGKDRLVDGELPRVYIMPDDLRFPWLKGAPDERI